MNFKKDNCFERNHSFSDININNSLLSSLEKRMENTEKFLIFFEDLLKLKNEEKIAEVMIDNSSLSEIEQKIVICEEDYKNLVKKKNALFEESLKKLESFELKINSTIENKNSQFSNKYANSLAQMESLIKKNEFLIENSFETKMLYFYKLFDSKFEDILNFLEDISNKTLNTENEFNKNKELVEIIQKDHQDFLNIINILKENSSKLEISNKQISELKLKFNKILEILLVDITNK